MNRNFVYPGALPQDTDILSPQRNAMIALGFLAQATVGAGTYFDGLACTQTTVASLSVLVGPGSAFAVSTVDATAFGSLAADTNPLVKMGINEASTTLGPMTAPATAGQSVVYLVQAAFSEADGNAAVLSYYNSANFAVPYVGPGNTGASQNTTRNQTVTLSLVQGTAATTGSQTTPAPTTGNTGLYAITIANGQTTITSTNIATLASAPFIANKLGSGMAGYLTAVSTKSAAYTITTSDNGALIVAGAYAMTLPSAPATAFRVTILSSATGTTILPNGNTVNLASGATSSTISLPAAGDFVTLAWDGSVWRVVGGSAAMLNAITPATVIGGTSRSWQNMTASRSLSSTFTAPAYPIEIIVGCSGSSASTFFLYASINGGGAFVIAAGANSGGADSIYGTLIIPANATYQITLNTGTLSNWMELR